jgi:outer membrane protein OmpA-like peptidoglycan-associated protein
MDRFRVTRLAVLVLAGFVAVQAAEPKNRVPRETFGSAVNVEALEDYTLIDLKPIYFIGKTTFSAQARAALGTLAKQWPKESVIEIRGYADGAGSPEQDLWLSKVRAEIIAEFLSTTGISPERIRVVGLGEIDSNGPALKPEHQRVDVRVFVEPSTPTGTSDDASHR